VLNVEASSAPQAPISADESLISGGLEPEQKRFASGLAKGDRGAESPTALGCNVFVAPTRQRRGHGGC
jgi:hypothetical protein